MFQVLMCKALAVKDLQREKRENTNANTNCLCIYIYVYVYFTYIYIHIYKYIYFFFRTMCNENNIDNTEWALKQNHINTQIHEEMQKSIIL